MFFFFCCLKKKFLCRWNGLQFSNMLKNNNIFFWFYLKTSLISGSESELVTRTLRYNLHHKSQGHVNLSCARTRSRTGTVGVNKLQELTVMTMYTYMYDVYMWEKRLRPHAQYEWFWAIRVYNCTKNIQGSRCLLEICVNGSRDLCQWHEKCVQHNLELTHITKPKWWRNLIIAHGL